MSLVLDASAFVAWLYAEGNPAELLRLYEAIRDQGAFVPPIWEMEVLNVMLTGIRKGRHDRRFVEEQLADLALLRIEVDREPQNALELLPLAFEHRLTSYDTAYLALALRRHLPLATLDRRLAEAARTAGIPLFWQQ